MKTVVKKGNIFAGYRGTEVKFYEVVHTTPKTVLLVSIKKRILHVKGIQYIAVPVPGSGAGMLFRRWVITGVGIPACRISDSELALLWDGCPCRGTYWKGLKKELRMSEK